MNQLLNCGSLNFAIVGVFTPQKLSNTTNQGFAPFLPPNTHTELVVSRFLDSLISGASFAKSFQMIA